MQSLSSGRGFKPVIPATEGDDFSEYRLKKVGGGKMHCVVSPQPMNFGEFSGATNQEIVHFNDEKSLPIVVKFSNHLIVLKNR